MYCQHMENNNLNTQPNTNTNPPQNSPNLNVQSPPVTDVQPVVSAEPGDGVNAPTPAPDPTGVTQVNISNLGSAASLSDWPGAFKLYKISKDAIKLNLKTIIGLIGVSIGLFVVYDILALVVKAVLAKDLLELIYTLASYIITAAIVFTTIESVKGNKINISEAYNKVFAKWLNIILVSILTSLIALVSLVLLIVPFFFIFPRIYLALYYVIDQNMQPVEAIKASWEHTKGNVGKLYGIIGVFILIVLPVVTIIGIIATIYLGIMYSAAFALYYNYINKQNNLTKPA